MHRIQCAEIWGGIKNRDIDLCTSGMTVSLYSSSCDGGKGGDAYYFSVCSQEKLTRLALADVVGHGEQVSQVSQWVYEQLAAHMNSDNQPGMLAELNARLLLKGFDALTTAVILSYYVVNRHVFFSYAGHPPVFSRQGIGGWHELQLPAGSVGNLPLGVASATTYSMGELACVRGDRLLLYTDGVLEAPAPTGEFFGVHRLKAVLEEAGPADPMGVKAHVLDRLRAWVGGPLEHDDVTLIAIQLE